MHIANVTAQPALSRRRFLAGMGAGLLAACSSALAACSSSASDDQQDATDPVDCTLFVFDTVVTISAYCSEELLNQAQERCYYFENRFSRTVEGSDIWNINEAKGQAVEVAQETADVISRSLEYSAETDGLFDISIGAVSTLWDFNNAVKPADSAIKKAIEHIDYRCIQVEGSTVTLADPEAKLDLGGIAKGYIADDLASLFREGGCTSACINLGGNVYVLGAKPDGSDWNVGIQDPNDSEDSKVIASCKAHDKSVVTSGLYERKFEKNGKLYYHILDPKTGYPVKTDLLSSSIYCDESIDGDVYATVLFLLGHDKALEFIEGKNGLEGLVIDEDDKVSMSSDAPFKEV